MGRALPLFALLFWATSCTELREVPRGLCGNGFVEPEAGEDCDGSQSSGFRCRAPGQPFECRWECSSGQGDQEVCPAEFGCGQDGVCRAGSGQFASAAVSVSATPLAGLTIADMDGDARGDVVGTGDEGLITHYFGSSMQPSDVRSSRLQTDALLKLPELPIAVGELSGDSLLDVVAPHQVGLVVKLGTSDRSEQVTAHAAAAFPPLIDDARLLLVDVLPAPAGDEIVLFAVLSGIAGLAYFNLSSGEQATPQLLTTLELGPSDAIEPFLIAPLDTSELSPCDEIVIAFEGKSEIAEFSPCRPGDKAVPELNLNASAMKLKLPAGRVATRTAGLFDLNADGKLDLVVGARAGEAYELAVGWGVGDGSFHSLSPPPAQAGDGQLATLFALGDLPALALGHLNQDGVLDWVDAAGVKVSTSSGAHLKAYNVIGPPWSQVFISDFNTTGGLDIAAASAEASEIVLLNNVGGGVFSEFKLPVGAQVSQLTVGDFDGDLLSDLAISRSAGETRELFSVAYGSAVGGFDTPIDIGVVDPVQQVMVGRGGQNGTVDGADDMLLLAKAASGLTAALIAGSTSRRLRAPFVLSRVDTHGALTAHAPLAATVGSFGDDAHDDLALLTKLYAEQEDFRLFLVPAKDEARLSSITALESDPLSADVDWLRATTAKLDLENDGIDEIVLLGPTRDGMAGRLQLARATFAGANRFVFELEAESPIEPALCRDPAELEPCGVVVADLDGDGSEDLAGIGRVAAGQPALAVWFGGGGVLSAPTLLTSPENLPFTSLTTVSIGRRGQLLALAGGSVLWIDVIDRALAIRAEPALEGVLGTRIAGGDLDGDGVHDLVVGSAAGVSAYRGLARSE